MVALMTMGSVICWPKGMGRICVCEQRDRITVGKRQNKTVNEIRKIPGDLHPSCLIQTLA